MIFHALSGVNCIGPTCLSLTEDELTGRRDVTAPDTIANEKRKNHSESDDNENGFYHQYI
ncbi:hypothetical protein NUBL17186_38910 [Klebsiella quasipneumoniae]|nr:hypothetical protein KAM260_03600 [Klebsiella pneumoniae]GKO90498.1 hypothetical protein NUBL17186_38910 [Klebsiella quasipneumoniae]GLZ98831.1 hypothetical protein KML002_41030 [Klebsiella quasipneumoniae subsp. similipneumoniae]GJK18700.1 hypothetical protein TUM17554_15150 [Klebsiella pneumoniae]GKP03025.1 hypothetical protein NUKP2_18130 [Klebsiella quasipneumoniae]